MTDLEDLPARYQRRILSGIRPTPGIHIGNYFGAIADHLRLQDEYVGGVFYFIADLHELTDRENARTLADATVDAAIDYLALGLKPDRINFYRQSDVPQISELMWILSCNAPIGTLLRGHAYKEAQASARPVNAGVLLYPVLMAADILALRATDIPVGSDQLQHLEFTRDIARRCNHRWGAEVFPSPQARFGRSPMVRGTDGRKMSHRYRNTIPVFGTAEQIRAAVNSIATEPVTAGQGQSEDGVVLELLGLVCAESGEFPGLRSAYVGGELNFATAKAVLTDRLVSFFSEARDRRDVWRGRRLDVEGLLVAGAERARMEAQQTLELVREVVGVAGLGIHSMS